VGTRVNKNREVITKTCAYYVGLTPRLLSLHRTIVCILHVDQYTRMQPAGNYISGVVYVHEKGDNNRLTSGMGHTRREFFSSVPVENLPACIRLEHTIIDLGQKTIRAPFRIS
jgi:hypothetical protein